ncbi:MAG: hypothetical protein KJ773_01505, partial [Candidatus Thermoplasmatota archaeon]|nr:hypothetical protein [Candidatus Thermoplasmatota archaeon]
WRLLPGLEVYPGAMHLIYQSYLALISCDDVCTAHGGLFFCLYSCKWPLIPGLKTGGFSAFITKISED